MPSGSGWMPLVFWIITCLTIRIISGYGIAGYKFWAAALPIAAAGYVYAETRRRKLQKISRMMPFVFGIVTGFVIGFISGYNLTDWKFWAAFLPIATTGYVYAEFGAE